jgi:hypothetical protein
MNRAMSSSRLVGSRLTIAVFLVGLFAMPLCAATSSPNFGPNVLIFDSSMTTSQIQTTLDSIAAQQVDNEFGTQRYAILF